MMAHIWCPGCSCDVAHVLTDKMRADHAALKAEQRQVREAVKWIRQAVNAMEAHARAKGDVERPIAEIYRTWSADLLAEVEKRFPLVEPRRAEGD